MNNEFRNTFEKALRSCNGVTDTQVEHLLKEHDDNVTSGMSEEDSVTSILKKYFVKRAKESKASYRDCLASSLDRTCPQYPSEMKNSILRRFDNLEKNVGGADALEVILETYGSEKLSQCMAYASQINYRLPQSKIGKTFEDALTEANKKTIEHNPLARVRESIKRFNASIKKCSATLTNYRGTFEVLNPDELAELEMKVPKLNSEKETLYSSWANYKQEFGL